MTQARPTLLLTRPQAASERLLSQLADRGIALPAVISPVIEMVAVAPGTDTAAYGELVFTSAAAVDFARGSGDLRGKRAWVVGPRTAEAAQAAGLETVSADGDSDALVALICRARPSGPILHLHGRHTRGQIADRLSRAGFAASSAVVYDQRAVELTQAANSLLSGWSPVIVPLYSPRSARLLGEACEPPVAPCTVVAISEATAQAWPHAGAVIVSAAPNGEAMLDTIAGAAAG